MLLAIPEVFSTSEVAALSAAANDQNFVDGRATAGRYAREVKQNQQARHDEQLDAVMHKVRINLEQHPIFSAAARIQQWGSMLLSQYERGDHYGLHVDDALMRGIRTDLSFTVFLSPPEAYEGGELLVHDQLETRAIKLNAGDVFLYPSHTLHQVAEVTCGTRLVIVGWLTSWLRDPAQREIVFNLDQAITALPQNGEALNTLLQVRSNLLRMWAGR